MSQRWFPSWRFAGWSLLAIVVLWGALQFYVDWMCTGGAKGARDIRRAVVESHVVPPDAEVQYGAGLWRTDLFVYGVRDAATQDRVIEVVRAARERLAAKPVTIEFRSAFTMRTTGRDDRGDLLRTEVVR